MNENEKDTSRDIDFFITGRDHSKQNSNVPKIESRGRTVPSANVPSANNNVKREQKPSSAERQPVTRKPKPVQPKKSKEYDGLFIEQILNGSKNSNSEENEKTKMIVDGIHVKKDDAGMKTNKIDKVPPSPKKVKEEENKKTEESSPDYDENFDGDYYEENDSGKLLTSVLKAVIYILGVLVASIVISYTVIVVSNDVFAFVKPSTQIDVVIPESPDLSDIADILKENGVIKYPGIFKFYTKLKDSKAEFVGGTYTVSPSMNYDMLKSTFKLKKGGKTEVSVTVPEGYTIDQIINLLLEKGIGTKEGYIDAIQNYPFNYWFVEQLTELSPDRKYRLEGYLYPDTYYFYSDSDEVTVINKFLSNFQPSYFSRATLA